MSNQKKRVGPLHDVDLENPRRHSAPVLPTLIVSKPNDQKWMLLGIVFAMVVGSAGLVAIGWFANRGRVNITELCSKYPEKVKENVSKVYNSKYATLKTSLRAIKFANNVIESYKHEINANRAPNKVVIDYSTDGGKNFGRAVTSSSEEFLDKLVGLDSLLKQKVLQGLLDARITFVKDVIKKIKALPKPAGAMGVNTSDLWQQIKGEEVEEEQTDLLAEKKRFYEEHQNLKALIDDDLFKTNLWSALKHPYFSGRESQIHPHSPPQVIKVLQDNITALEAKKRAVPADGERICLLPWVHPETFKVTIHRGGRLTGTKVQLDIAVPPAKDDKGAGHSASGHSCASC